MKSIAQQQELKFLALTLALVLFVGFGSIFNMVQAPEVRAQVHASSRVPASVSSVKALADEIPVSALKTIETLDWSCGDQAKTVSVTAPRVRIVGKACAPASLSILNETNGLSATVIEGEKGYSTDYVELNPGQNQFAVNWTDKKGRAQKTLITIIKN